MGAILTPRYQTIRDLEVYLDLQEDGAGRAQQPTRLQPTGRYEPLWLQEVRLRALRRVLFLREQWQTSSYPGEEHLAISHSEVDRALLPGVHFNELATSFYRLDEGASSVSRAIEALTEQPKDPVWAYMVETLNVPPADENLLKLAYAAAADPRLPRVLGYIEDGTTPTGATVGLVGQLFDGMGAKAPSLGSAVYRWKLLQPEISAKETATDVTVFRADASLLDTLLGRVDPGDWSSGTSGQVVPAPHDGGVRAELARSIASFVSQILREADPESPVCVDTELVGPAGSGRKTLAAAASALLNAPLIAVDCAAIAELGDPEFQLVREVRRAVLSRAAIAVWNHEMLPPRARSVIAACPLTFSCVEKPLETAHSGPDSVTVVRRSYCLPALRRDQRLSLWSQLSSGPPPGPVANWGLRPSEIVVAAKTLPAGQPAVIEVCRRMLTSGIDDLLTHLPVGPTWDDLVLPPSTVALLKELEAQFRYKDDVLDVWGLSRLTPLGRGTTALFSGPSGTGKTMTAQVLARSLGLDCLRVDLAGVVSKYIGDTEKQLRKVFDACERSPALLFFDEADALFGKRTTVKDAHDRFANIEIDYILQAMELFNGIAVLATNRKGDLDQAFMRRLRFIVNFAPPSATERETLWHKCFDGAVDSNGKGLAQGIEYERLAKELDLTGAQIKSAALAAAFTAKEGGTSITMAHVVAAARREIEKSGKVVRPGSLEAE